MDAVKEALARLPSEIFAPVQEFKMLKGEDDDDRMKFQGLGAVFGNLDANGDTIAKGAFKKTIKEFKRSGVWPAMLMQHGGFGLIADDLIPLGVWEEIDENDAGLPMTGILADTQRGIEAHKLMKMKPRPAISGLSIGFFPIDWREGKKPEDPRRTLKEVELIEVSLVTFPANGKARVHSVKSGLDVRSADRALRDAGFSRSEAKTILAAGFGELVAHRDVGNYGELAEIVKSNMEIFS